MCWYDFEASLLQEFTAILAHFDKIKDEMNEDTRKDFLGLVQYTLTSRSSFRPIATSYGIRYTSESDDGCSKVCDNTSQICAKIVNKLVSELIEKDLDSFAPEYSYFSFILKNHSLIPESVLIQLCCKYWKHRYPSVKKSFIIPAATKIQILQESGELKDLLTRRLLKGKLEPFDYSIKICKLLGIPPEALDFYDKQLAALKDLLHNHQQLNIEDTFARQQTGCHCD